jgi:hypothetical protein
MLRNLEWRVNIKSAEETWKEITEKKYGNRLTSWESYMEAKLLEVIKGTNDAEQLEEEVKLLLDKWNSFEIPINLSCRKFQDSQYMKFIYLFEFVWLSNFEDFSKEIVGKIKNDKKYFIQKE